MFASGNTLVKNLITAVFSILLLLSNAYASEGVEGNQLLDGGELHEKSCVRCHDDKVYKRKDRKIKSYQKLEHQVNRCNGPAKANWNNDQINAVTDYLNDRYYKFDPLK